MKFKKITSMIILSVFLIGLMANSTFAKFGSHQTTNHFKDMKDAGWAEKHVTKMTAQDIIKGYTDGTFKPNKPVTQAEAVVLVMNAAKFQEETESVSDSVYAPFKDGSKIPQWAQKYVSLAATKGFIESGSTVSFQSNKPATRQWTAKLIINAFGLDEEAAAKSDVALPFTDSDTIAYDAVGSIALAFERNIIAGMPDGNFQPNKPVTRAQIAVMLGLTSIEQDVKSDDELSGYVKATTVTEDVYTQGSITIQTKKSEVTLPVAKEAIIYVGESKTSLDKLAAGSKVEIIVKNSVVVFIETQIEAAKGVVESVYGQTVNLMIREDHQFIKKSFTAAEDVKVVINGKQAKIEDLKPGSYAKLTLNGDNTIASIKACKLQLKEVVKKEVVKKEVVKKVVKTETTIQKNLEKQNEGKTKVQKG